MAREHLPSFGPGDKSMPHTRRAFLRDGLYSLLSMSLLLASSRIALGQTSQGQGRVTSEIPIEAQKDPVYLFSEETFKPYVNGIFQAPNARGEMIELKLTKVQGFKSANKLTSRAVETKSFALIFKASDELPPFTSIHTIRHSALGEFDLFLTKRKTDDGDLYYEAVITHFSN
jgi:hypothetical protein